MKQLIPFEGHSLIELIRFRAEVQGSETAYIHLKDKKEETAEITYKEFEQRILLLAEHLASHNIKGERVILMYSAGIDYIVAFFAVIFAGGIAVPVYEPRQSSHFNRLATILADAQPKLLLTHQQTMRLTSDEMLEELNQYGAQWLVTDTLNLTHNAQSDWQPVTLNANDIVFLQYTSGSTGNPKGVMVSNFNMLDNSEIIRQATQPTGDFCNISWLPPYHDMGLIGAILQPLYAGYPCVLMSPISAIQRPIKFLKAIADYKGTIAGGPNFIFEACVNRIRDKQLDGLDLSSWQVAFNGAEPINANTMLRFSERFKNYGFNEKAHFPCYGMAENTLFVSGAKAGEGAVLTAYDKADLHNDVATPASGDNSRLLVSSGNVGENIDVKIVDPASCVECEDRYIGEIWIKGPSKAQGYWKKDEVLGEDFAGLLEGDSNKYLRSGDLGFFDNNELYITGRNKDLLIIHGKNHYPQDIEISVSNAHQEIKPDTGAAFSVDVDGVEQLVIVQELNHRVDQALQDDIAQHIKVAVSQHHAMQLSDLVFIRHGLLPKTTSGKIQRQAAKRMYLAKDFPVFGSK